MNETVYTLTRKMIDNYTTGQTETGKYVSFNLYEHIEKIHAYLNSKHISGDTDALGREKPFFNITVAASNIWYRATDIDRKDMGVTASNSKEVLQSFCANQLLDYWMKRIQFNAFLNKWGRTKAQYGSAISKFVEKDDTLVASVIPWNRIICDSVDFYSNPKIERLFLTKSQLLANKSYDQEVVKSLLDTLTTRKLSDKQKIDNKSDYIELYEIHGEFPLSYLTGREEDEDIYTQQMHVITFLAGKDKGDFDDFTLFAGKEKKDPYVITHLLEEEGRVIGKGAVEYLFEPQWMVNHSAKLIKDQLDSASKLIFQTSDPAFVGQNMLSAVETGDILLHSMNQPLTQVANNSHDITSLMNMSNQYKSLAQEITSTPDAMMGNTMPSGTAYRQVAVLNQEAHSLFELMTENSGNSLEFMLREHVIPFIKSKMDSVKEISALLEANDVKKIDAAFIKYKSNEIRNDLLKKQVLSGQLAEEPDMNKIQNDLQESLIANGNQRFITPSDMDNINWSDLLKDFEWTVNVNVTGESSNKEAVMTTLTTLLQSVSQNPGMFKDPRAKLLFNKIVESTGVASPIELNIQELEPQIPEAQPQPKQTTAMPISGT